MAGAYAEFSAFAYEDVAELLLAKFEQQCNVWIVRPAERLRGVFSCYSNFVTFVNDYGAATECACRPPRLLLYPLVANVYTWRY